MDSPTPDDLRAILMRSQTIALVGASANPARPSHGVMRYLQGVGYRVIPVNPGLAGQDLLGARAYASLSDIPERVDLVDVFRRQEAMPAVLHDLLACDPWPAVLWMQLGITAPEVAARARQAGLEVVQDRCTKVEHARLIGAPR